MGADDGAVDGAVDSADAIVLSAALIVRDEAHHLPECLASIERVVDEVVVVDTGSVDNTVEIAESHGARVFHEPWQDDFALARNAALDRCRGSWILYIDADERVRPHEREVLRAALAAPDQVGANVTLHPVAGHSGYRELRLFRNDPRIRFEGLIHETIWPAVIRVLDADGGVIGDTDVVLDHVGYHGCQQHKHERNLPLLLKALTRNPDHIYCWFHLGQTYAGLGRFRAARQAWVSGVEAVRGASLLRPADSLPFLELIADTLDQGNDADDLISEARWLFPEDPMLAWLDGRALVTQRRFDEAVEIFEALIAAEESGELSQDFGYNPLQFTSFTHAMLGTCHHQCGDHERAAHHFARAERFEPDNLEYRAKRQLNQHLAAT